MMTCKICFSVCGINFNTIVPKKYFATFHNLLKFHLTRKRGSYDIIVNEGYLHERPNNRIRLIFQSNREVRVEVNDGSIGSAASAIGNSIAAILAGKNGLLVHGCLLARKRDGYLFIGPSGAGKSTISNNAKNLTIITDDICAIRIVRGKWMAYGVPLLQSNGTLSLASSAFLKEMLLRILTPKRLSLFSSGRPSFLLGACQPDAGCSGQC